VTRSRFYRVALLAGATFFLGPQAIAQGTPGSGAGGQGWFMPNSSSVTGPRTDAHPRPAAKPAAPAATSLPNLAGTETPPAPQQVQLPPAPAIPEVPRGSMPPASVIGVLSIPDVLRASTAYQQADKTMAERRQKLNEDAQKEQVVLRDLGQQLGNERAKMSADQIRAKERELQDRITESRRKFSERGRIVQEASQYALAQIERTLSDVVQRVAAARGMNIVLQRAEVALNQAEFDITAQVAEILNKALPTVLIPPEGVSPTAEPPAASAAPAAKPASASPTAATPSPSAAHKPAASHPSQHR
jgi:Skp family chaperone for outer membrane proteins